MSILEKPFIKLIRSPNGTYFYDVNTNEVVSLSEDTFQYYNNILQDQDISSTPKICQEIDELKSSGYLSSNKVKTIRHSMSDYLDVMLDRCVSKITLQLTQDCNFKCSYCAYSQDNALQRSHQQKTMSLEIAKKGIDFLRDHSIDVDEVSVGFYGGEPLIEFELLKQITAYAKDQLKGKKLALNLTTNVSLLSDDIFEYLIKNEFDVLISVDGPEEIHDKNRVFVSNNKGTFKTVEKRLKHLYEKYSDDFIKISANMVMDPINSYDKINELFKEDSIFSKIEFQATIIEDIFADNKNQYSDDYVTESIYDSFLGYLTLLDRVNKGNVHKISLSSLHNSISEQEKMLSRNSLPIETAPGGPCVPGIQRLFIDVKGNFFPCERVSETSSAMIIGNIHDGFNLDKAMKVLNIGFLTADKCRECWAFTNCKLCAKHADSGEGLVGDLKNKHCVEVCSSFLNTLREIVLFKELTNNYSI